MDDQTNVVVSLPQVLDLALGTPEVGSVNFNILHNFLHILINQLNFTNKNVEYRGDNANQIKNALSMLRTGSSSILQAHLVADSVNSNVNPINVSESSRISSIISSAVASVTSPTVSTAVPTNVPPIDQLVEPSPVPSVLPEKITSVIPVAASTDYSKDISSINNRLNEFEANLSYLNDDVTELRNTFTANYQPPTVPSSVSEDIESFDKNKQSVGSEKLPEIMTTIPESTADHSLIHDKDKKRKDSQGEIIPSRQTSLISRGRSIIDGVNLIELKTDVSGLKSEMTEVQKNIEIMQSQIDDICSKRTPEISIDKAKPETQTDINSLVNNDTNVDGNINATSLSPQTNEKSDQIHSGSQIIPSDSYTESTNNETGDKSEDQANDISGGLKNIDSTKIELTETVQNMEMIYSEAVRNLEFRVAELETEMKALGETVYNSQMGGETEGIQEVQELVSKIQEIHADMEKINKTATRLSEEKEKRDSHTNVIIEQIELLKTIKADKEDLEDALADKADATVVDKKVSYDKFNIACDDLARGVEDAITKLTQQEYIWQESLNTVQQEIDNKLDKIEISPIREFINNRLQILQNKIKELAEKKNENEAAGTRKILTGLHCISCNKDAVMRMEQEANYQHVSVPPSRSIKPYLTYELDRIRKQHKKLVGRNMNQFNAAVQEMGKKTKPLICDTTDEKSSRDHLCNRYCGGSHTVTTPQQRVMRMGHFSAQWGPEAVQLTQGMIRGTDGQLYHSRSMPPGTSAANLPDVCGPDMNLCCSSQNPTASNQPGQHNRPNHNLESPTTIQTTVRRASQRDHRRIDSLPQSTRRSSGKKINEVYKNDRSMVLPEVSLTSPTAPSQIVINNDEYFNEAGENTAQGFYESKET